MSRPVLLASPTVPARALRALVATAVAGAAIALAPRPVSAQAGVQIGVTIQGEVRPGVYGRVDIGQRPPPVVVYPQPVVVVAPAVPLAPVYLHVPPGHARNWSRHCAAYGACGVPVMFVRSAEYDRWDDHRGRGRGRDDDDDDRGRGHGNGRGHGHGRD